MSINNPQGIRIKCFSLIFRLFGRKSKQGQRIAPVLSRFGAFAFDAQLAGFVVLAQD